MHGDIGQIPLMYLKSWIPLGPIGISEEYDRNHAENYRGIPRSFGSVTGWHYYGGPY